MHAPDTTLRDLKQQESYRRYVICQLRNAITRAKDAQNEIRTILIALEQGAIDPKTAIDDLWAIGNLIFLVPRRPPPDAEE
jgi:hypothetical protein